MIKIGQYNTLEVLRFTSVGAYLGDEENNDVLLPNKYLTHNLEIGDEIEVFIYNDSEDRPVATTETPLIFLNQFAYLRAKHVTDFGAFLDWGLEKDLLVPFKEQGVKMKENGIYLVYMYLDEATNRLVATAKTNKYLLKEVSDLSVGDEVDLLICEETELGRKVIVNQLYSGLIFKDRQSKLLQLGSKEKGYVLTIREDGKIDISLAKLGEEKFDEYSTIILDYLSKNNGVLHLTDSSHPEEIKALLGMSKKSFKRALGNLYKRKKIVLKDDCVELV